MLRMGDQCKLAAEHISVGPTSLIRETHVYLDEFFKGITSQRDGRCTVR
jgi:hypothetical protein